MITVTLEVTDVDKIAKLLVRANDFLEKYHNATSGDTDSNQAQADIESAITMLSGAVLNASTTLTLRTKNV